VYRLLKGVKISISTDRNVNDEFIPGYNLKNKTFGTTAGHVKVTFPLFLERISK
jgi:hypothetical protein